MLLQAAERHYRRQASLAVAAKRQARLAWRRLSVDDLDAWQPQTLTRQISLLQLAAAQAADPYVTAALREQDTDAASLGSVNPAAFAAMAGDGRSLVTLLDEPRIQTKEAIGNGTPPAEAWLSAGSTLEMMVATAVQDAGRVAAGVAMTARPTVYGQVRQLSPPSCSRCAILAGRWYRWDAGFPRHPHCDCIGIPAAEDVIGSLVTDPNAAVRAGQVTGLSRAEMQAFSEGADLGQLVNVHREGGIYTAWGGRRFTREGVTRRGIAGKRLEAAGSNVRLLPGDRYRRVTVPRLTPEQIYRDALDRDDAIRLLKRFGYIV